MYFLSFVEKFFLRFDILHKIDDVTGNNCAPFPYISLLGGSFNEQSANIKKFYRSRAVPTVLRCSLYYGVENTEVRAAKATERETSR